MPETAGSNKSRIFNACRVVAGSVGLGRGEGEVAGSEAEVVL